MTQLSLRLLGSPQLFLGEKPVQVGTRKALALLIVLAVTQEQHQRDSLATLLWPEHDQQKARASLRNGLSVLKRAIGGDWLRVSRQSVGLDWERGISADFHQFTTLLSDPTLANLQAAIDLYRDDFLTGFTLRDCPAFDEWQFFESEQLRQKLAHALELAVGQLAQTNAWEAALGHARRWVQLDPLHEVAQMQLITLYAQAGQKTAAVRQFDLVQQLFEDELGVPPSDELLALAHQIRQTQVTSRSEQPKKATVHHVPAYATSFIGRNRELANIADNLQHKLVTLTGMGGIGKTRLAVQSVALLAEQFPDGIYYIDLVPLRSAHQLVPIIINALGMPLRGADPPPVQLARYLNDRRLLLIIDNFEHLIDAAATIAQLRRDAPGLHLLITSRETLNVGGEWVYPLNGLPVPDGSAAAATFSSVQLFVARARQLRPDFSLAENEAAVVKICELVEGLPLGLELAAAWVRLLPCAQIAEEIAQNADFLTSMQRDRPDRHRSLRVVFEHSWGQLSAEEQQTFAQLSVFRGGATLAAARAVTNASLFALHGLVNRSLLRLEDDGHYRLHELLRQFASEKLAQDADARETTLRNFTSHYLNFLHQHEADPDAITPELENIRFAWQYAIQHSLVGLIKLGVQGVYHYFTNIASYDEGIALLDQAVTQIIWTDDATAQHTLGHLLQAQGDLIIPSGELHVATPILLRAIAHLEPLGAMHEVALCYGSLGLGLYRTGAYAEAQAHLRKAVLLRDSKRNPLEFCHLLMVLSAVEFALGNSAESHTNLTKANTLYRRHNYEWGIAHSLRWLGKIAHFEGRLDEARKLFEKSAALCRATDHPSGEASVYTSLGLLQLESNQLDDAHATLQKALTLGLSTAVEVIQQEALLHLGYLMIGWDKPDLAANYLERGLRLTSNFPTLTLGLLLGMAQIGRISTNTVSGLIAQHPSADAITKKRAATLPVGDAMKIELDETSAELLLNDLVAQCLS